MDKLPDHLRSLIDHNIPTLSWAPSDGRAEFLNQRWRGYSSLSSEQGWELKLPIPSCIYYSRLRTRIIAVRGHQQYRCAQDSACE
jgi:hypothetical protein